MPFPRTLAPLCALVVAASACAPAPLAPEALPSAPSPAPSEPAPAPEPLATDFYLPPEKAAGARYCLNPESEALQRVFGGGRMKPEARFDRRRLAADVAFLHQLLRATYAGYPELVQHRDFDVVTFFADWQRRLLARPGEVSFREGFIEPFMTLRRAHFDNHLAPSGWGGRLHRSPELAVSELLGPREPADDPSRCHVEGAIGHTLRGAQLFRDGALHPVAAVSWQGASPSQVELRCSGKAPTTLTPRALRKPRSTKPRSTEPRSAKEPLYTYEPVGEVGVITVRRLFGSPEELAVLDQLVADYPKHRQHKHLLFDFRGNGGGNDAYVYAWIDRAKRGSWTIRASVEVEAGAGPCNEWNFRVAQQLQYERTGDPEAIREREAIRAGWPVEAAPVHHEVFQGLIESDADQPYEGTITVLVDRHAGSSGESAPEALRRSLGATIVGERTAGFLEFGNIKPFVLPHTGFLMAVPSKRNYHDPPVEGVGLPVDVYLDEATLDRPARELVDLVQTLAQRPAR